MKPTLWCIFLFLCSSFLYCSLAATAETKEKSTIYCVTSGKIDLNPDREIIDGKDMFFLQPTTRPLLPNKGTYPAVAKRYVFSPDGKTLEFLLDTDIKWSDGSQVTADQIIASMRRQIGFRPVGKKVEISAASTSISPTQGRLVFKSEAQNLKATLHTAFSGDARHNRFWFSKKNGKKTAHLLKHPLKSSGPQKLEITVDGHPVTITNQKTGCDRADLSSKSSALQSQTQKGWQTQMQTNSQLDFMVLNSKLSAKKRRHIAGTVRSLYANSDLPPGTSVSDSYFEQGETGFNGKHVYADLYSKKKMPKLSNLKIYYESPILRKLLEKHCHQCTYMDPASKSRSTADIFLASAGVRSGRVLILQDILEWDFVRTAMKAHKKSIKHLEEIASLNEAVWTNQPQSLQKLEQALREDISMVPLLRRRIPLYSAKASPVNLKWGSDGEIELKAKPKSNAESL